MALLMAAATPIHATETPTMQAGHTLEASEARAISVAYAGFVAALPEARAEQYEVLVRPDDAHYVVTFLPKLAEGERPVRGGRTSQGQEWTAWVSRETFELARQAFAR
ncbi:hypothetical protein LDO31_08055 [Luteimonas sp. XNQY3]|nr:hypothetical protein [Luteimonas sp. XNQY3]MCD9006186.1 hypothetical protein [Luteimonas sp. XNQY3]